MKKYRDAETGAYESEAYARENPRTTVAEDDGRVRELEGRVCSLEAQASVMASALAALTDRVQAG